FKAWIPSSLRPILRPLYHSAYRLGLRMQWRFLDWKQPPSLTREFALPPARLRFRVAENASSLVFYTVGRRTAERLESTLRPAGFDFAPGSTVLDFGCGCGRTLLWFARAFPQVKWHGVDIDAESVEWCRSAIPAGVFAQNGPLPPIPFPDAFFD